MPGADAAAYVAAIEELRRGEGAALTIHSSNPRPAVEICDGWTRWQTRRFAGDTVLTCLQLAVASRRLHLKEHPND
jgi:hypothetical protein